MSKKSINQLKEYFKAGKRPTENQFGDLLDSYAHLEGDIINNLVTSEYVTHLQFPSDYQVGDYVEFLAFQPEMVLASGFYEISVAYTRGNIASAATHIAAVSHANPNIWRECGRINRNNYVANEDTDCFTFDVNGALCRFRIRATRVLGVSSPMPIVIKVKSINRNLSWTELDLKGNDTSNIPLQPMTDEWDLFVGSAFSPESAKVGLKVKSDGNVGIGTATPQAKLDVQGNIVAGKTHATEGINGFSIRYEDGSLNNWGSLRSSAETYMSYGVKADNANGFGWVSSNGTFPNHKSAVTAGSEGIKFLASTYQQSPTNTSVTLNELMRINPNGNVGIGTGTPESQLHVQFLDSEPKSFQVIQFTNYPDTMNAAIRYTWYNEYCDVGIIRGGSADISAYAIKFNGNETARFAVSGNAAFKGKVEAKDFVVSTSPTADFVFAPDYNLRGIHDLEKFISEKQHLPEIPSAKEMIENGLTIGEFQIKLLQKIEELTLYAISQNKEIEQLKSQIKQ